MEEADLSALEVTEGGSLEDGGGEGAAIARGSCNRFGVAMAAAAAAAI